MWCRAGKIICLAKFVTEHREALNFDLMTNTPYQIDDIGGALSWSSLYSFITHLRGDSALARDLGKATGWEDTLKTNVILADIYDLLQVINANLVAYINGKKPKNIKPYPRPNADEKNERKLGKKALPIGELREWIRSRQHGRR